MKRKKSDSFQTYVAALQNYLLNNVNFDRGQRLAS